MKKLIAILSTIAVISMFSGCLIVTPEDEPKIVIQKKTSEKVVEQKTEDTTTTVITQPTVTAKYSITCKNGTSFTISDWCVKKDNIVTYANSGYNRSIRAGGEDMIMNLPEGYYKVYFSFEDEYQLNPSDYFNSESIYLNRDVIYTLYERQATISCRAAGTPVKPQLYLAGSDGSEIDLICE